MIGRAPTRQAAPSGVCCHLRVMSAAVFATVSAWIFLAAGAAAQYTVLGGAPASVPDEDALRRNVEEARWSAGPFRFQPWLGLRKLSYVRQQQSISGDDAEDQLTVTLGAGLRGYAPMGSRIIWAAHVLPEYVWWQDDETKEGVNGRYGLGMFVYANRLKLQASHQLTESQDLFSDEIQEYTTTSSASSRFGAELKVFRGVHVYTSWNRSKFEGDAGDSELFTLLDRVEDGWGAGLRVRSHRGWALGLGVRHLESEFEPGARDYSYEADAVTLDLGANIGRLSVALDLEEADIEPRPGSLLEPSRQTFGTAEIGWKARKGLALESYYHRRRQFSLAANRSLIVAEEAGVRVQVNLSAWNLWLTAGQGSLESEGIGAAPDQTDDYDLLGATLSYTARRWGTLQLNVIQRRYDVGLLSGDRDVSSIGLSIQLGEVVRRLSVGETGSSW